MYILTYAVNGNRSKSRKTKIGFFYNEYTLKILNKYLKIFQGTIPSFHKKSGQISCTGPLRPSKKRASICSKNFGRFIFIATTAPTVPELSLLFAEVRLQLLFRQTALFIFNWVSCLNYSVLVDREARIKLQKRRRDRCFVLLGN